MALHARGDINGWDEIHPGRYGPPQPRGANSLQSAQQNHTGTGILTYNKEEAYGDRNGLLFQRPQGSAQPGASSRRACKKKSRLYEGGVRELWAGGALGFDTLAAETVLLLREQEREIRLRLAPPCAGQDRNWGARDREIYRRLRNGADDVVLLSERLLQWLYATAQPFYGRGKPLSDLLSDGKGRRHRLYRPLCPGKGAGDPQPRRRKPGTASLFPDGMIQKTALKTALGRGPRQRRRTVARPDINRIEAAARKGFAVPRHKRANRRKSRAQSTVKRRFSLPFFAASSFISVDQPMARFLYRRPRF